MFVCDFDNFDLIKDLKVRFKILKHGPGPGDNNYCDGLLYAMDVYIGVCATIYMFTFVGRVCKDLKCVLN